MSDIVFKIEATQFFSRTQGRSLWSVQICDGAVMVFTPDEWKAFRSLLAPSAKADFTIEERSEHGTRIN